MSDNDKRLQLITDTKVRIADLYELLEVPMHKSMRDFTRKTLDINVLLLKVLNG